MMVENEQLNICMTPPPQPIRILEKATFYIRCLKKCPLAMSLTLLVVLCCIKD